MLLKGACRVMSDKVRKKLPVGIESFEEIVTEGFYYVDKTEMIKDLVYKWGKVNLFTRPRRFGKSLNMSMLKTFFEIGCNESLFEGMNILKEPSICKEYMGRFPVIFISLKDVDGADFSSARSILCSVIANEALRFYDLLEGSDCLNRIEKRQYEQLINADMGITESFIMPDSVLRRSLKTLSALLEKYYGKKVLILIDEYDVPLAKAYEHGYYDEMVLLLRGIFHQALKTNDSLYFAVLTGCLRVAKDSIFTGLNNLKVFPITTVRFDEYFGFTDNEVKKMLSYYGIEDKYESVKNWYDGYRFGDVEVYCPWDVISYCDELLDDDQVFPQNYWSNTSGNEAVRQFIEKMGDGVIKGEMEDLIAGETVEKDIHEDLTYNEIYASVENIWSLLFMTGYLTQRGKIDGTRYRLSIPNMEIRGIFIRQILSMFKRDVARDGKLLKEFCEALQEGDAHRVKMLFQSYLEKTISIRDTFVRKPLKENFYHGILLGILGYKDDWYLRSNKESGNGFSDISVEIEDKGIGIVIEIKYAEDGKFDSVCREALRQIEKNGYVKELKKDGCHTILKYGIACCKKECQVIAERD